MSLEKARFNGSSLYRKVKHQRVNVVSYCTFKVARQKVEDSNLANTDFLNFFEMNDTVLIYIPTLNFFGFIGASTSDFTSGKLRWKKPPKRNGTVLK